MNKMKIAAVLLAATLAGSAAAQDSNSVQIKPYGFIRTLGVVDTRESVVGTADFFYYLPKDEKIVNGVDLNAQTNFSFAALTSRVGLDILGYEVNGWKVSGRIESDFYAGVSGVTGTATLRLRLAFVTLNKEGLVTVKVGQAWHPMATDLPHIFSLNSGAPFGPFSRTPQATADWVLGEGTTLTTAAVWQMQYPSAGPSGPSVDYMKYSGVPEVFVGLNVKRGGFTGRAGVDLLSIRPRHLDGTGTKKVKDRITTFSPYMYLEYTGGQFAVKAKTIFAQAGEHMNLNGGYGVTAMDSDGTWHYTPTRNSSTWVSMTYGKKVQAVLFGGYVRNFGTAKEILSPSYLYFSKNSFSNMNRMFRITPEVIFNWGKVSLGLEYEHTGVQYGSFGAGDTFGLATQDLHWVHNNRLQVMFRYSF